MLFAFEAAFDGCELVVVTNALFFQPFDDLLVGLLDALSLVVLYHDFVQTVLQDPDIFHQWALLDIPSLAVLHLPQHVLQVQ
jgi:hypothetical protein